MLMKSDFKQGGSRAAPDNVQYSLQYGDARITYAVRRRSVRKTQRVAIHVEPDGRVLVDAPEGASEPAIRRAVRAKARWIHVHVAAARERKSQVLAREYVSGESWLYLAACRT